MLCQTPYNTGPTERINWLQALRTLVPRHWSLRATFISIMAGTALIVLTTALILIWSIWTASGNLERAAAAQSRLEQFLQLSGRVSDYGITALQSVGLSADDRRKLDFSKAEVERVFQILGERISSQVNAANDDDHQAAVATKGLGLARMHAQFRSLHRQILRMTETPPETDRPAGDQAQNIMNVFGVQFAPLLAQALEDERQEIQAARSVMAVLRSRIVAVGAGLIILAILFGAGIYLLAGRPILRRISETVAGAKELAAGNLERRLKPGGGDELTLLMAQFNRMASRLQRRETRLLEAQGDLKTTIAERTRDLRESNERLAHIDEQRRQFFSDVSHELRTPLTVILGESDLALKNPEKLGPDLTASISTIKSRGESLRSRVDDLLRVARSESGQLDLRFATVDLHAVSVDAVNDMKPLAEKYDIRLEMAGMAENCPVRGDPDWLRQAISGLLVNAIRYGDTGRPVAVETGNNKSRAFVAITDHGPGIPAAERPFLFKRFYRGERSEAQTAKRGDRGFGIGLSLIKWVVDEHGGTIAVETNDGVNPTTDAPAHPGSTVRISVPLVTGDRDVADEDEDSAE